MPYECYVDGASRGQGNPSPEGHGAVGVLIYRNGKLVGQYARGLGRVTSSVAEYEAVLLALVMCWSAGLDDPIIYSDSEMVVKQVQGQWGCKNEDLLPLLYSVREIEEDFRFRIEHVSRHIVAEADALANDMLDMMLQPKPPRKKKNGKRSSTTTSTKGS